MVWMIAVQLPAEAGIFFLFAITSRSTLGPSQPPSQWVLGAISPEVKRPGREADHSPPSSAEVKNERSYTSIRHTSLWHGTQLSIGLYLVFYFSLMLCDSRRVHRLFIYTKMHTATARISVPCSLQHST